MYWLDYSSNNVIKTLAKTNLGIDTIWNNPIFCPQLQIVIAAELGESPEYNSTKLDIEHIYMMRLMI